MVGTAVISFLVSLTNTFARVGGTAAPLQTAAEWYFNPFFALATVLFPTSVVHTTLRGFLQLLFFGVPASGVLATGGPAVDPWAVCVFLETVIAMASVAGAVALVRGRRAIRPRRVVERIEAAEAG
jgi:hypothetical protein